MLTNKGCIITCAVFFCVCLHGEICVPSLAFLVSLIHACRREALLEARRLNSYDFPAEMFIYGGLESMAIDKGVYYYVTTPTLLAPGANVHYDDTPLQLSTPSA